MSSRVPRLSNQTWAQIQCQLVNNLKKETMTTNLLYGLFKLSDPWSNIYSNSVTLVIVEGEEDPHDTVKLTPLRKTSYFLKYTDTVTTLVCLLLKITLQGIS